MKNYHRIFLIGSIIIFLQSYTSAQTWQWANIEAGAYGSATSIAKDNAGNIYIAGQVIGNVTFGTTTYTIGGPNPNLYARMYLLKYDATGNLLWSSATNTHASVSSVNIDTDNAGNVYLSCGFSGSLSLANYTTTASGTSDIAVLKFSNAGTLLWAKSFGGSGFDYAKSIATDGSGNSWICGTYNSPTITFSTTTLTGTLSQNFNNGYVVKLDASGNVLWANKISSSALSPQLSVEVDANSNAYVAGAYGNQMTAGSFTLPGAGGSDVYVAKYSNAGVLKWLVRTGAFGIEYTEGINIDPFGNVYLAGSMYGPICAIGSNTYAGSYANIDAFVAKVDSSGNFLWSDRLATSGSDKAYSLVSTASEVFVASLIQSTSITIGAQTYTFSNNLDGLLITQYNATGSVVNNFPIDGGGKATDLCIDNCALYFGGTLNTPTVNFGNIVLTHTTSASPYVARLQLAVGEPTISISGSFSMCSGGSTTLQANGANTYTWSNGATSSNIVVSPATTSVYIVTGSSASLACPASKAQTVVVVPLPNITALRSHTGVCAGNSVTLSSIGANTYSWSTGAQTQIIVLTPSQTSVYSVTGFSNSCSSTATISVVVNPLPLVSAITNNSVICKNNSAIISALGADTYTWFNGANAPAISVSPTVATIYTVVGTSSLTSCSNSASIQVFVDECTSLKDIKAEYFQFSVFPNPCTDYFFVRCNTEIELKLLNGLGMEILELQIPANENTGINLSDYAAGVYFISIPSLRYNQKLLLQN